MTPNDFPAVWLLAGGYFHADWDAMDDDEWSVIDRFVRDEPELGPRLADEIDLFLRTVPTDAASQQAWLEAGAMIVGPSDGGSHREWLRSLERRARSHP